MGFRALLLSLCVLSAVACGMEKSGAGGVDGDEPIDHSLSFDPNEAGDVLPGESVAFEVRYVDGDGEPVSGTEIELALVDDAPGASLTNLSPRTNSRGIARASVRVGSDATRFRVRALAPRAEPAYFTVRVSEVDVRSVVIEARYEGLRELATRTVTARANVPCLQALSDGMPGEVNRTVPAPRTTVSLDLDPGVPYAVLAWGRDVAGGLLARGCAEITYSVEEKDREERDMLTVDLLDHELRLEQPATGPFKIELELDVAASSLRLGAAVREGGLAQLPNTAQADADALLDAIEAELRRGPTPQDANLLASSRQNAEVAASLGGALVAGDVGPSRLIDALEGLVSESAQRLVAGASYAIDATQMSIEIDALYGSRAGGLPLQLSDALLAATRVVFIASFDEPSARIDVSELSLTIDLSAYGTGVFDALEASNADGLLGLAGASRSCRALASWVAAGRTEAQTLISQTCDADCLQRACDAFGHGVLAAARDRIGSIDGFTALTLSGPVWVADRDDNNLIDALGSTQLAGIWHGEAALEPDAVTCELREAPPPLSP